MATRKWFKNTTEKFNSNVKTLILFLQKKLKYFVLFDRSQLSLTISYSNVDVNAFALKMWFSIFNHIKNFLCRMSEWSNGIEFLHLFASTKCEIEGGCSFVSQTNSIVIRMSCEFDAVWTPPNASKTACGCDTLVSAINGELFSIESEKLRNEIVIRRVNILQCVFAFRHFFSLSKFRKR